MVGPVSMAHMLAALALVDLKGLEVHLWNACSVDLEVADWLGIPILNHGFGYPAASDLASARVMFHFSPSLFQLMLFVWRRSGRVNDSVHVCPRPLATIPIALQSIRWFCGRTASKSP